MTARAAVRRKALTIAELYDQPPLMPVLTFTGSILGMADSTAFQLIKEGRLPVETVRVARKRYVRTSDVLAWLHLQPNGDGTGSSHPAPSVENDPIHTSSN